MLSVTDSDLERSHTPPPRCSTPIFRTVDPHQKAPPRHGSPSPKQSMRLKPREAAKPHEASASEDTNDTMVVDPHTHRLWAKLSLYRRLAALRAVFCLLCIADTVHWAYMLRDDDDTSPNMWKYYTGLVENEQFYLVGRLLSDIFVCILGIGAAMWTRKSVLVVPCCVVETFFLIGVRWAIREPQRGSYRREEIAFIGCEFAIPLLWTLEALLVGGTLQAMRTVDRSHRYSQPPVIVLTVKNDENDESVQIEID
ncbi:hypothetical protein QR680_005639 [Steinernema hermaphroditum]|uniref:Uncharacterized protein n=1 Tax=Steinernema hermaphroditum TaxID=289476 RepID=A0AA39LV90_9BILA|nr:hypothetical protein QR680_005639 [Steinernema hermaphroditum]